MKKLILLLLFIPLFSFGQDGFRKLNWGDTIEDLLEKYSGDISTYGFNPLEIDSLSNFESPKLDRYMWDEESVRKSGYKDNEWLHYEEGSKLIFYYDEISGIRTQVGYIFKNGKLVAGRYHFYPKIILTGSSSRFRSVFLPATFGFNVDERLEHFKTISKRLNNIYKMKFEEILRKDAWKCIADEDWKYGEEKTDQAYALKFGVVRLVESYESGNARIEHMLGSLNNEYVCDPFDVTSKTFEIIHIVKYSSTELIKELDEDF